MQDGSTSLRRALGLLDVFSPSHPVLTIRDIAKRSGIPRSTAHRIVQDLLDWGALERGEGGLRLGVKLFELGTMAPTQTTLREAASPFLHTLNEVSRLTANLAVREGHEIVYLEKIVSASLRVPHTRLGGRAPLHSTALGKAILAFSDREVIAQVLAAELKAVTPHTITDPDVLESELARVRRESVAYDVEESNQGLFCVAAPVLDNRKQPVASISVTGATALVHAERFAPAVQATARAISRRLFEQPPRR